MMSFSPPSSPMKRSFAQLDGGWPYRGHYHDQHVDATTPHQPSPFKRARTSLHGSWQSPTDLNRAPQAFSNTPHVVPENRKRARHDFFDERPAKRVRTAPNEPPSSDCQRFVLVDNSHPVESNTSGSYSSSPSNSDHLVPNAHNQLVLAPPKRLPLQQQGDLAHLPSFFRPSSSPILPQKQPPFVRFYETPNASQEHQHGLHSSLVPQYSGPIVEEVDESEEGGLEVVTLSTSSDRVSRQVPLVESLDSSSSSGSDAMDID